MLVDCRGWGSGIRVLTAGLRARLFRHNLAALYEALGDEPPAWLAEPINRILGRSGSRALSKLAGILLAAIAVMMVRKGIVMLLQGVSVTP